MQPSTVTSKWFGDSVRYVKAAFSLAAKLAPCVVFVDEVRQTAFYCSFELVLATLRAHSCQHSVSWDSCQVSRMAHAGTIHHCLQLQGC